MLYFSFFFASVKLNFAIKKWGVMGSTLHGHVCMMKLSCFDNELKHIIYNMLAEQNSRRIFPKRDSVTNY